MLIHRHRGRATALGARARRGLSLAEMVVVLAVLGVGLATVSRIGVRQQAHYRDAAARTRTLSSLHEGATILSADLRNVAPPAGDIYPGEMRDASIAFRSTVGTFLLCESAVAGASGIDVIATDALGITAAARSPPDDPPDTEAPSAGDSAWLYDSGVATDGTDDSWRAFVVTSTTRDRRSCGAEPAAVAHEVFHLTLAPAIRGTFERHAPIRSFRRARYALYQSSDGLWYLGFSDCRPIVRSPPCAQLQPVSGPYEPHRQGGDNSGLTLRYFDDAGNTTDDPAAVARIEMVFRGRANPATRLAWEAEETRTVTFRNAGR